MKKLMISAVTAAAAIIAVADNPVNITSGDLASWAGYKPDDNNFFYTQSAPLSYTLSSDISWNKTTYANFQLLEQTASFELDLCGHTFTMNNWGGSLSTISGTNPYALTPEETSVTYLYKNGTISVPSFSTGHSNASNFHQYHTFDGITFANISGNVTFNRHGVGGRVTLTNGTSLSGVNTLWVTSLGSGIDVNNEVIVEDGSTVSAKEVCTDYRDGSKAAADKATREALTSCEKITVTGSGTSLTTTGNAIIGGGVPGAIVVDQGATATIGGVTYINNTNDATDMGAAGSSLKVDNGATVTFGSSSITNLVIGYTGTNNAFIVDHGGHVSFPNDSVILLDQYGRGENSIKIDHNSTVDISNAKLTVAAGYKERIVVDNGSTFKYRPTSSYYYIYKSDFLVDNGSTLNCNNTGNDYFMFNVDGGSLSVKNGSTFAAKYIFVGEGVNGKNNTLLVEDSNIQESALWFGNNGKKSGGNNRIIFRGANATINGGHNLVNGVVFKGQGDILELDGAVATAAGGCTTLKAEAANGCYGTLRLINGATATFSSVFDLNASKSNIVEVLSGSTLNVSDFMQGSADPTRSPSEDLTLKIGSGATLNINNQYQMAGTNNTLVVDNGTINAKGNYPFYFAQSNTKDGGPTILSSSYNYLTLMGAQPRIRSMAHPGDENGRTVKGCIAINKGTVKFVLDPDHPYTEPVLQAYGNCVVGSECNVVFENIPEMIEKMSVTTMSIPIARSIDGSYDFLGNEGGANFKALNNELALLGARIYRQSDDRTVYLELSKPAVEMDGTPYASLPAALNAATGGETISLLSDVLVAGELKLENYKSCTVNLNGYDLTVNNNMSIGSQGNPATNDCYTLIIPADSTLTVGGQFMSCGEGNTIDLAGKIQLSSTQKYAFYFGYNSNVYDGVPESNTFIFRGATPQILIGEGNATGRPDNLVSRDCWICRSKVKFILDKNTPYSDFLMYATHNVVIDKNSSVEFVNLEDLAAAVRANETLPFDIPLQKTETPEYVSFLNTELRAALNGTLPDGVSLVIVRGTGVNLESDTPETEYEGSVRSYLRIEEKPEAKYMVDYDDDLQFSKLGLALEAALDGNGVITLLDDVTNDSNLTVSGGSELIFDLAGYTYTFTGNDYAFVAEGENTVLTIEGNLEDSDNPGAVIKTGQGSICKATDGGKVVWGYGALSWDGDTAGDSTGSLIKVEAGSYLEVYGGEFRSTDSARCRGIRVCSGVDEGAVEILEADFYENAVFVNESDYPILTSGSDSCRFKFDASAVVEDGYCTTLVTDPNDDNYGWYVIAEYFEPTQPDPADSVAPTAIDMSGMSSGTISFTVPEGTYTVWSKESLSDAEWTLIGEFTGDVLDIDVDPDATSMFYMITE